MADAPLIELKLPPELYKQLQAEAQRQRLPLPELVREAISEYLEAQADFPEDTPDEEIEAGFLQGWHDLATDQTRPAREVLKELRKVQPDDHSG